VSKICFFASKKIDEHEKKSPEILTNMQQFSKDYQVKSKDHFDLSIFNQLTVNHT